jgi:protein gp37
MATTAIEWAEQTWNPTTGCTMISPGCTNCYAMRMAARNVAMGQAKYARTTRRSGGRDVWTGLVLQHPDTLDLPRRVATPTTFFVNSMSDLFHADVPLDFIQRVFAVMNETDRHVFQVLTKRAERLEELAPALNWTPNIWTGVSVESTEFVFRIDHLRRTPGAIKFLSVEPLLGALPNLHLDGIDWAIVGGESGPGARHMRASWVRDIRDQCVEAGVAFFFKQWGGVRKADTGRELDGCIWDEYPRSATASAGR